MPESDPDPHVFGHKEADPMRSWHGEEDAGAWRKSCSETSSQFYCHHLMKCLTELSMLGDL